MCTTGKPCGLILSNTESLLESVNESFMVSHPCLLLKASNDDKRKSDEVVNAHDVSEFDQVVIGKP